MVLESLPWVLMPLWNPFLVIQVYWTKNDKNDGMLLLRLGDKKSLVSVFLSGSLHSGEQQAAMLWWASLKGLMGKPCDWMCPAEVREAPKPTIAPWVSLEEVPSPHSWPGDDWLEPTPWFLNYSLWQPWVRSTTNPPLDFRSAKPWDSSEITGFVLLGLFYH
jgi:hypothetical protein